MVSHKNYNLCANEDFVIFLTSKLITCFIDGLTLKMKSKSIALSLNGSEDIYWILEGEVHSIWDLWISGLQGCKGNGFSEVGQVGGNFWSGPKYLDFMYGWLPLPKSTSPQKFGGGEGWGKFDVPYFTYKGQFGSEFFRLGEVTGVHNLTGCIWKK